MYRVEEIRKLEQVHIELWQKLWDSTINSHFFNSPQWFTSYLKAFEKSKPHVFFLFKDDQLVAVLPLIETRKFKLKTLACIESKYSFLDKATLLIKDDCSGAFEELLKKIAKQYNVFLAELQENELPNKKNLDCEALIEFSTMCPKQVIGENVLENMSKKQQKKLLAKIRQNEKKLSWKIYTQDLEKHLKTMLEIERASNKTKKKISIFDKPEIHNLYQSIVANAKSFVAIGFLYLDGKPIAHRFGYFYRDTFLSVHIAFLKQYSKIGPGKMLTYFFLKELKRRNVKVMDFSVGDNDLKQQFSNQQTKLFNLYCSKSTSTVWWWKNILKTKNSYKCLRKIIQHCRASNLNF